jgi:hypothetical protein
MVVGEGAAEEQPTGATFRAPEVCEVSVGQAYFRRCCHAAIQLDSVLWAVASLSPLLPADPILIIKHVAHVSFETGMLLDRT